jgi:hypothetical protein
VMSKGSMSIRSACCANAYGSGRGLASVRACGDHE